MYYFKDDYPYLTLVTQNNYQFIYCQCEVQLQRVILDEGCYYVACSKCMKKVIESSTTLQCENYLQAETRTTFVYTH